MSSSSRVVWLSCSFVSSQLSESSARYRRYSMANRHVGATSSSRVRASTQSAAAARWQRRAAVSASFRPKTRPAASFTNEGSSLATISR